MKERHFQVELPEDKSGEIPNRECGGKFPTWNIAATQEGVYPQPLPKICSYCNYQRACMMEISIILYGKAPSIDRLNAFSAIFDFHQMKIAGDTSQQILSILISGNNDED